MIYYYVEFIILSINQFRNVLYSHKMYHFDIWLLSSFFFFGFQWACAVSFSTIHVDVFLLWNFNFFLINNILERDLFYETFLTRKRKKNNFVWCLIINQILWNSLKIICQLKEMFLSELFHFYLRREKLFFLLFDCHI